jgi:hypothetical protein
MSRGELIMEDNTVKEAAGGNGWANEFREQEERGDFGGVCQVRAAVLYLRA